MSTMTQNAPAASASTTTSAKPAGRRPVFYTPMNAIGTQVSLWKNSNKGSASARFNGKIGERRVSLYVKNGANGAFLSIVESAQIKIPNPDGKPGGKVEFKETRIGAANIVVSEKGYPKLAIRFDSDRESVIWASVSREASEELLVEAGLNLQKLAEKRAAAEALSAKDEEVVEHLMNVPPPLSPDQIHPRYA